MMRKRRGFKEDIQRAAEPYEIFIDEKEKFRGAKEDKALTNAFSDRYEIIRPEGTVNDPDMIKRFAHYAAEGDYDLLFCDDDIVKNGKRVRPFFKPPFAPETAEAYGNYFSAAAVKKDILKDGRIKMSYLDPVKVKHIPEVLCHYVKSRPVIKNPADRAELDCSMADSCSLSIVILSKDHPELLKMCLESLRKADLPEQTEVLVIDNGSSRENRTIYRKLIKETGAEYFVAPMDFNYSKLNNYGVKRTFGDYLLFLNDDIEIPEESADFAKRLITYASREHVGAVGMKLLYPGGNLIQHCGITLLKSGPSHKLCGYNDDESYYHGINKRNVNFLAVTGACLCVKRELFEGENGFDENLPLAYNDVDLCVRFAEKGLYNVCINDTFLYHHESASRKDDRENVGSYLKLKEYSRYFYGKHRDYLKDGDPFYNENLTFTGLDYRINVPLRWEISGVEKEPVMKDFTERRTGDVMRSNVDFAGYRLNDAYGNEDFFEVSGWIFYEKKDVARFEPAVMIVNGDITAVYSTVRVFRRDVEEAFKKQLNACMAGFYTRIAHASLEREGLIGRLRIIPVLLDRKGTVYVE